MNNAIILIGAPYSGKSTFACELANNGYNVVSSDYYLELWASEERLSYNEAFNIYAKAALDAAMRDLHVWSSKGDNIVVDMTNMSRKSRAKKIAILQRAGGYRIDAYVFKVSEEETARRVTLRPYKFISPKIIADMNSRYEPPFRAEGFTELFFASMNEDIPELARKAAAP